MNLLNEDFVRENEKLELFRFVSFFDLYEILLNKRLRFSKLSTFEDKNEGLGKILQHQESELLRFSHIDPNAIAPAHVNVLQNHYLSCWTKEPDQISMWALYSRDSSSIRISTTVGKLWGVLNNLYERMLWSKALDKPGSREPVSWYRSLGFVEYVDFFECREKIRERYRLFREKSRDAARVDKAYYDSPEGFMKDYQEFHREKIIAGDGLFLKDRAYMHENEVRAVLHCAVRNDLTKDEWLKTDVTSGPPIESAKQGELAAFLFAEVGPDFVDTACFDPRLPRYKREIFESIFACRLPKLGTSRAFGYAPAQESFASDFDGNPL